MEIERKFKLDAFPEHLPLLQASQVEQGYLSVSPTVRIRSKCCDGVTDYRLCIKGKGTLVREEVELPLEEEQFFRLKNLLHGDMIRKDYRVYSLSNGLKLECSLVDAGTENEFMYAEVEFSTEAEARAFVSPTFLGEDVTEIPGSSMSAYWQRTRG